ncbi:Lrp/AsnC family transcriptional regulator [Xanthomonas rydalmerensis]|uniref:Lrp/AsnC family transcriptional regulator n=2 Tax=Xanthomonas rydalmerensis TaxID=3046274 RepID=A0ABZ0JNA5_9XANT|nr:Lrp/AsnC family transcriptional regulator [Xanthomonas sp. DM-2023]WOS41275.1 Lrp/AsnC family transcriptional regulator [Xanthomonas sp. DM-2023]WOS45460.1 Lrp/AsnC family transcriptional regulator [Xanthomonas sp. DM-2023]WOS49639.1 Lrp/AsnC family transcriptional regulator [Xanthomonas sp. DM-2023]WOS53819.1 Lrp/AsnC family transcriptional regulator [Xanthomonas sp. DM-2023]
MRRFSDESTVQGKGARRVAAKTWRGDALDYAILEALQCDGRIALAALGRRIGLSQPAMSERVRRLEEQGVITGYTARVDPRALGLATSAIVRLRTTHAQIGACLELFAQMPQVLDVHRVTGEDCFVLRVLVPAPAQLEPVIDALARFGAVTTSVVLRSETPRPIGRALMALAAE